MLFPDPGLTQRLERFRAELQVSFARTCSRVYPHTTPAWEPVGGGWAVFTHLGSPINRAQGLGMDGPVTAADLDRLEAFYFDRGAPAQVDITPNTDRSLIDLVGERGYRCHFFLNMLYRPVLPEDADLEPEADVAPVPQAQLPAWADLVADGFGYKVPPGEINLSLITGSQDEATAYLASVDSMPAGGGAVQIKGRDAYLGSTAVLPAFRRRGVQTALLKARLASIARAGGELVQVQTTPGSDSQRNVMRAGFLIAYTKTMLIRQKP